MTCSPCTLTGQQAQTTGNFGNLRYGDDNLIIGAGNSATADGTGTYRRNYDGYTEDVRITAGELQPSQFLGAGVPESNTLTMVLIGIAPGIAMVVRRRRSR